MGDLISRSDLLEAVDKIIGHCASYKAWAIRNAISVAPAITEESDEERSHRSEAQGEQEV